MTSAPTRIGLDPPALSPGSKALIALALAAITVIAYRHGLDSQFIGDDHVRITAMSEFLRSGYRDSITAILPDRPMLVMTILLNYTFGGLDPWGYKALSLAFHIAVGLVFFALLLAVQKRFFNTSHPVAPALAAAVFLVHPLNSQALLSAIQRGVIMASLGALASFLAFLVYLSSRRQVFLLLSLLFFVTGILSKSFIISLPFILLLYLFLVERNVRRHVVSLTPFFAASLLPMIPYLVFGVNRQTGSGLLWYEYLSVQTRVVWMYFRLFFAPANLRFYYEIDPDPGVFANLTWLAILGHLLILGAAAHQSRRKPLVAFGVFSMYLALLPESGIFAIDHPVFEHRTYFPMLFFLFTLFALTRSLPVLPRWLTIVPIVAIGLFVTQTNARIGEVDTHEKWALNTYGYKSPGRESNIWLLDDLYSARLDQRGLELCRGMIAADPDFPPYHFYQRFFSFAAATPMQRQQTVELVSQALLNQEPWLLGDSLIVNRFLGMISNNSKAFSGSPIAYLKNLERVYRNQVWLFFRSPDFYAHHIDLHRALLSELRDYYERELRGDGVDDAEFVQYLNILGQGGLYEPKTGTQWKDLLEELKIRFPQRVGLIDASWKYYREFRTVMKL